MKTTSDDDFRKPENEIILDPANSQNPYDNAGYYHNEGLDFIIDNADLFTCDSTNFKNTMDSLITEFACQTGYGVPSQNCHDTVSQYVQQFFDEDIYKSLDEIIEEYSISAAVDSGMMYLIGMVESLQNKDSTELTIYNFIEDVKTWEDSIYNYSSLTTSEKKQLLNASSILRYSIYYWWNVYSDPNHAWHYSFSCGSIANKGNNPRLLYFEGYPWWGKLIGVAIADAGGAIASGLVGGVTYSAVTAVIAWWDDISYGLDWLGDKISGWFS